MNENWFTAKGIFLHKFQLENQKQWYEERIVLLKAKDEKEALKYANKDAKNYIKDLEDTEFIEITDVYSFYDEEISDKCEIFSSKAISQLNPQDYLETFYPNALKDCEAIGDKHSWHNFGGEYSACYNCLVKRKGKLWETEVEN